MAFLDFSETLARLLFEYFTPKNASFSVSVQKSYLRCDLSTITKKTLTGCSQTSGVWKEKKCVQVSEFEWMRTGSGGAELMLGGLYKHNANIQNKAKKHIVNMTNIVVSGWQPKNKSHATSLKCRFWCCMTEMYLSTYKRGLKKKIDFIAALFDLQMKWMMVLCLRLGFAAQGLPPSYVSSSTWSL